MHTKTLLTLALAVALATTATAGPYTVDELVGWLGGDDAQQRAVARQMLVYEDAEVVRRIVPLLKDERTPVAWAAQRVLEDFASMYTEQSNPEGRRIVADALMPLVAPDQPVEIKKKGLRLLPYVLPDQYDVAPIAALLQDPELKEKARVALRDTGTPPANRALCQALDTAEPAFQAALLYALAQNECRQCLGKAVQLASSPDEAVRAAAARALAWTGNPEYLDPLKQVVARAERMTRFDAWDALLRLTNAMAAHGGHWNRVMALYREILDQADGLMPKSGAIAGLGKYGDETAVDHILAALETEQGPGLEPAALQAFEDLRGQVAVRALLDAYPQVSRDMRVALIGVFGRKGNPAFFDAFEKAAASDDPALRTAAIEALQQTKLPEGVPVLAKLMREGDPESRAAARNSLRGLARTFAQQNQANAAGTAFLALYKTAEDEALKLEALEGIKQFPVPEAFEVIVATLEEGEAATLPPGLMAGTAKVLVEKGRKEEANQLIDALVPRIDSTADMNEVIRYLGGMPGGAEMAPRLGVVTRWQLVGPFPWNMDNGFSVTHINEPDVDPAATYEVEGKTLAWKAHDAGHPSGMVNMMGIFGAREFCCAYALARIEVPEAAEAQLRMGSDDGIKVWVNGEAVHANNVDRGTVFDQDKAPVQLKAGVNELLVESTQNGGGWNFHLRLTRPDGTVLPFTPVKIEEEPRAQPAEKESTT